MEGRIHNSLTVLFFLFFLSPHGSLALLVEFLQVHIQCSGVGRLECGTGMSEVERNATPAPSDNVQKSLWHSRNQIGRLDSSMGDSTNGPSKIAGQRHRWSFSNSYRSIIIHIAEVYALIECIEAYTRPSFSVTD